MLDRLAFIRQAPELVEEIVRATAREALETKRVYDRVLDIRDVANVALGQLERSRCVAVVGLDGVGRHELAEATVRAATAFARSPLARRLLRVPVARFRPTPQGADVALVDRNGDLHVVRIEAFRDDAARVGCVRDIVAASGHDRRALRVPAVHLYSLRDGKLRSFATPAVLPRESSAHRAA